MGKRYSSEQREQRRQADADLHEQADEFIADAEKFNSLAELFAPGRVTEKVAGYSPKNRALLLLQAQTLGRPMPTDVETFKGWLGRGRYVRKGEAGLRISVPIGRSDEQKTDDQAAEGEPKDNAAGQNTDEKPTRPRFRMIAVFDVSQTEPVDVDEHAEAVSTA